jgi:hypothetical protein
MCDVRLFGLELDVVLVKLVLLALFASLFQRSFLVLHYPVPNQYLDPAL